VIRDQLRANVEEALFALGVDPIPSGIVIERPAKREHGDWSTNAALAVSKGLGKNPREVGQALADHLTEHRPEHVNEIEIAGPGFVNFRLDSKWLYDVLEEVIEKGEVGYASPNIGNGGSVNVEFVSANPTGPIHAGGGRWAAYGDSLARIMTRCGYKPHKEYYINDRGNQTVLFGKSLTAARQGEPVPEGGYQGQYIQDWATEMPDDADATAWGVQRSLVDAKAVLASMNVEFDTWSSEKAIASSGAIEKAFDRLTASGHVYEADGATWLRTTDFGDSEDRVLIRSDGEMTYFTPDIAYHLDKYSRGDHLLIVLGADHHGYVPRMRAALTILGKDMSTYEAIVGQNVRLTRDGSEIKMSKRAGTLVEIGDLVDAVGPDVARFAYLLQSVDSPQTIDLDVLTEASASNPVYYVQYGNARINQLGKVALERGVTRRSLDEADLTVLNHDRELEVLRQLSVLPEALELALNERAPHKITNWVRDLASAFNGFYHDCPILRSDVSDDVQQARLWLAEASRIGLAIGLDLLGVSAPEEM